MRVLQIFLGEPNSGLIVAYDYLLVGIERRFEGIRGLPIHILSTPDKPAYRACNGRK